jgi:hypothetical protein
MYKLLPSQDDDALFFLMDGDTAMRHGAIGYLRCDFGQGGYEFNTTWFDIPHHLKTMSFKEEFGAVIETLRNDGPEPPLASRTALETFCRESPGKCFGARGMGYMIRTLGFTYYFRCHPHPKDYDIYCYPYENRLLFTELARIK